MDGGGEGGGKGPGSSCPSYIMCSLFHYLHIEKKKIVDNVTKPFVYILYNTTQS